MCPDRSYCYEYPRPAMTADAVVFAFDAGALEVLLIKRSQDPFAGYWALPGGFLDEGESAESAVARELEEETGLKLDRFHQIHTFTKLGRDPRGHTVTVAFLTLMRKDTQDAVAASDAAELRWFRLDALPALAFDHAEIIEAAGGKLRLLTLCSTFARDLLPERFALAELQALYKQVLGVSLDAAIFRRAVMAEGLLKEQGAELFGFDEKACDAGQGSPALKRFSE